MSTNRTRLSASDIVAPAVAADRLAEYRRFGYVSDLTMSVSVVRAARQWGSRPAVIEGDHRLTYRELLEVVERTAAWLVGAGVGPGNVVCWQTPNWWEAQVLGLAIWHAGAVSCPIAPFYREHELRQVIEQVRPSAVMTAEKFRGFAHAEAFDDLLAAAGLGDVARVVLRGTRPGWTSFDAVVSHGRRQQYATADADEPCLILFTSGTTAGAKAAVHSSRSLLAETRQLADAWGLSWEDVAYMAAPLQHITGVLNAMTVPLLVGASAVLAERWDPDEPCLILFTSGTTAGAKAAVHSSRSLLAETRQLADAWGLSWEDVAYMAAPLQHITGVLNAMTVPLLVGASAVLAERWDPDAAVADIMRHRVTYTAGATVFLEELTDAARAAGAHLPLRNFACGGAAVPRAVMERSEEQGIPASRVYGMTELPTVTVMNRAFPFDARAETDGAIAPGVQVRVVDVDGEPLASAFAGELLVRGPEQMLGYLDHAANRAALDDAGWFATGDVGTVDGAGFVTITGRLKDVINRGGEKFSARDIEDLLLTHPAVRHAAVVPGPDARFGEVPIAFVVVDSPGQAPADDLVGHLHAAGLARQKTPVAWHFVDHLPMTPSGKVKKFELVAAAAAAERQR